MVTVFLWYHWNVMSDSRKIFYEEEFGVFVVTNGVTEFKPLNSAGEVTRLVDKYSVPDLFGEHHVRVVPVKRTKKIVVEFSSWEVFPAK